MFFDKPGAELVQKVFSAIGNFGVDRPGALLVACPLGHRQRRLQITVELLRLNRLPIGQRSKILQPKVSLVAIRRHISAKAMEALLLRVLPAGPPQR